MDCRPNYSTLGYLRYADFETSYAPSPNECTTANPKSIKRNLNAYVVSEDCQGIVTKDFISTQSGCCTPGVHSGCTMDTVHEYYYSNYTPSSYNQLCAAQTTNTKVAVFSAIDLCSTVTNPTIDYPAPTSPCKPVLTLSAVSGGGQSAEVCKTLDAPFRAAVNAENGAPKSGVSVDWGNIVSPKDAAGVSAAGAAIVATPNSSGSTNSSGVSETGFKLGDMAGEYSVEANCPGCDKGSPQKFIAIAKCQAVQNYYQSVYPNEPYGNWCKHTYLTLSIPRKDPVWTTENTDCPDSTSLAAFGTYEPYSIKHKGCALSSISMVLARYGFTSLDPKNLNVLMKSYGTKGFQNGGVMWDVIDKITGGEVEYSERDRVQVDFLIEGGIDKSKMNKFLEKCQPVIVKVNHKYKVNGVWYDSEHWVVVTGKIDGDYTINDPSKAGDPVKQRTLLSQYGDIYSIRVFKSKNGGCKQ